MKPHPLTILFADDDQDDLDLLQEVLAEVAPTHVLHYVNHGENVLQSVKEKLPDLIFLDYNLPGCDGAECLKSLKEEPRTKDIPVVIYSTSSARYTLKECYNLNAAQGNGGQRIFIWEQLNLITVITGGSYNTQSFSDEVLRKYILPAFSGR